MTCPATRESIIELEDEGEVGCPLCGQTADSHTPDQEELT